MGVSSQQSPFLAELWGGVGNLPVSQKDSNQEAADSGETELGGIIKQLN